MADEAGPHIIFDPAVSSISRNLANHFAKIQSSLSSRAPFTAQDNNMPLAHQRTEIVKTPQSIARDCEPRTQELNLQDSIPTQAVKNDLGKEKVTRMRACFPVSNVPHSSLPHPHLSITSHSVALPSRCICWAGCHACIRNNWTRAPTQLA
jgi:hypothetical protein